MRERLVARTCAEAETALNFISSGKSENTVKFVSRSVFAGGVSQQLGVLYANGNERAMMNFAEKYNSPSVINLI